MTYHYTLLFQDFQFNKHLYQLLKRIRVRIPIASHMCELEIDFDEHEITHWWALFI